MPDPLSWDASRATGMDPRWRVPFNRPATIGDELEKIRGVLETGRQAGDGTYGRRCERALEGITGTARAFLTGSGTHALEMAALLLDFSAGDEVIVPSFTFPSTANAFVLRGARPIFADIRPDTLNIDESALPRLVTPRTRAIVIVHYAGVACEMDAILDVASRARVAVVEDNTHGLFGRYRGRALGSFGRFAALSFHETKNVSCGEGGALLLTDERDAHRAEVVREKGTDRAGFLRGEVDRYTWVDIGSSYLLPEVLAAILLSQLEAASRIQQRRREIWQRYDAELADWATSARVRLPVVPAHCESAHHIFHLLTPSARYRERLIEHLARRGILAVFHFLPLHLSAMGRRWGGRPGDCPITEDASERLLRLPLYFDLSAAEQAEVIDALRAFPG